jgi:hypothetical protein
MVTTNTALRDLICASKFLLWLGKPNVDASVGEFDTVARACGLTPWGGQGWRVALDTSAPVAASGLVFLPFAGRLAGNRQLPCGPTLSQLTAEADTRSEIYDALSWTPDTVDVVSDPIGLKPLYWAALDDGWIFATRILDLLRFVPAYVRPLDGLALHQMIVARAPFGDRTLHARVKRTPAGARYFWTAKDGLTWDRSRRWEHPAADAAMTPERLIPRLDARLSEILSGFRDMSADPWWISMSGGFDSRLVAATARRMGETLHAVTKFG